MTENRPPERPLHASEAVRLRAALRAAEVRHRAALAEVREQRDEAMERAADLERELDRLGEVVGDLERQLAAWVDDARHLRSECDRLEHTWREREEALEDDHRRMMAAVARGHERQIVEAVEARDAALAEADRAAEERERERCARCAAERARDAAIGDVDGMLAQHDEFIRELLESHERELATVRREHERTRRALARATGRAGVARGRRSAALEGSHAARWAATVERLEAETCV